MFRDMDEDCHAILVDEVDVQYDPLYIGLVNCEPILNQLYLRDGYVDFLNYKYEFVSGGDFQTFIITANRWVV